MWIGEASPVKRGIFRSHYISDSTDSLWEKDLNSVWKDWSQTLGHESDFVNILCFYWDELSIFKNNNNNKMGIHTFYQDIKRKSISTFVGEEK